MKTRAVRIYGANDLRLETFELPPIGDDGVRVEVVSDSIVHVQLQGGDSGRGAQSACRRISRSIRRSSATNPAGAWSRLARNTPRGSPSAAGVAIQPAHFYKVSQLAPGYSYEFCGGDATYVNIPFETLAMDCLLPV